MINTNLRRYFRCQVCGKLHTLRDNENASCGHSNLREISGAEYLESKFGHPYGDASNTPL